ncbi:MAG: SDR family oxidoreductase [Clostridiales bacterium]|nr:SDR family oxidoreductase [Clostridiales bacterium]
MRVLVLGATSGIGLACAKALSKEHDVIGAGRDTDKVSLEGVSFIRCDVNDRSDVKRLYTEVSCPDVIIFSQGCAYYGLHENISSDQCEEMVLTDLLSPIEITNHYLPFMKQRKSGHLIYISSVTADSVNPHGACYGACKAGIRSFAKSLFEEVRKTDVKVTLISPDLTDTDLYRNADFSVDKDLVLKSEDVTEAVLFAVNKPSNVDIFDVVVRPMRNAIRK